MSLVRSSKNVWCHMVAMEETVKGIRGFAPGQIACTIYNSERAAKADLKGFVKALHENGHDDIYDFTDDGKYACVEWTDKGTGKRMKRWITDLPFYYG